jgi:hypothetical protein
LRRVIVDQPEPPRDERQRGTLQAGEDDDKDQHHIEKELGSDDPLS